ncbi:hypothetical protein F5146DRAFT_1099167 [Armillaria mellea]|nr:hypothetical protein F5146DRAFT_1099167 [Armillaria mellea]
MTVPILIVGARPAGLITALSLAQSGIQVQIIDKSDSFHVRSHGFGVQPRTFELFQHLGVIKDIQKLSMPIPTMHAYKLPGGTVPVKTWDLPTAPVPTNGKEEIVAQYLIRSDGAKGNSRKLLGLTFQGETRDADGMVWGDVTIKGLMSEFWHIWGKPGHFTIMACPLSPTGDKFGIGITGQNFDFTHLTNLAKAVEFIKAEMGCIDLEFWEFTWLSHFRPNMWMVNKFQEGRAFVVGGMHLLFTTSCTYLTVPYDSAHVHSPTGGQGMNCSIQDASNLTWKLSLILKGLTSPTLLSTYNEEHLPIITQMLHATTQLYTHMVAKENPNKDTKEDKKASGWFWWRNTALEMYGINYQYSSIVLEERDMEPQDAEDVLAHVYSGYEGRGSLCAGDRAPDAPLGGMTLFSLFKLTVHTVLIFSKWSTDLEVILKTLPVQTFVIANANESLEGVSVLVDSEVHARKAYMVEEDSLTIVIVRPDSFIGAIITDVEGVEWYFSKVLI